jgi:hypothetical protein
MTRVMEILVGRDEEDEEHDERDTLLCDDQPDEARDKCVHCSSLVPRAATSPVAL